MELEKWKDAIGGDTLILAKEFSVFDDDRKKYALTLLWYGLKERIDRAGVIDISETPNTPSIVYMNVEKAGKTRWFSLDFDINVRTSRLPERKGVGSKILQYLISFLEENDFAFIMGDLSPFDEKEFYKNIPFYRKNGFLVFLNGDRGIVLKVFGKLTEEEVDKLVNCIGTDVSLSKTELMRELSDPHPVSKPK